MAAATALTSTSATVGPVWVEFTNAANIVLNASGTNSGVTAITITLPSTGAGSVFPNVPVAACCLNQANIAGAQATGLPAGAGIANVTFTNSTALTINVANAAAAQNIASGKRWILYTVTGV